MEIAVIGAGAIGSTLAGLLARSGEKVWLIGRPDQVDAVRTEGLRVDGALGAFTVAMQADMALSHRPDLALLAVKTQNVLQAVHDNLSYLSGVPIVTMQNGVKSDELVASLVPGEQIVGAVVFISAV